MTRQTFRPGEATDAAHLTQARLLRAGDGCVISPLAVFVPAADQGTVLPIHIGAGSSIGPFSVIYGGAMLADGVRVEEYVIVGKPERGYAVGRTYSGEAAVTVLGSGSVLRSGAVVYAGTGIGENTVVGHHTLLRSHTTIGAETQLGHHLTVERATRIGAWVRCSPGSHITSSSILADRVFLGAGVRTINDRRMIWREPDGRTPELVPPTFGLGARVGSGSVILGGIAIGEHALVGAGSVVTRNIPSGAVAYGVPARVRDMREGIPA